MKEKILKILKSNLLFSIILNSAVLTMCILITAFHYDEISDFYNSILISKNHFYYSSQINYIFTILVGSVQYVLTDFNCFVLSLIMLSYGAFTTITYVMAEKLKKRRALVFSLLFYILFALNHYSWVNSTRTAAVLFTAGFLLVLNSIRDKKYSLACWVGVAEITFGAFLNYYCFFTALGVAIAYFFGDMIAKKKYRLPFRKLFWYFRPFLLMFALATLVVIGLNHFSVSVNNATTTSKNFYQYSYDYSSVSASGFPEYNEIKSQLDEIGLKSESEYNMLKSGYYDEDTILNSKALSVIRKIQDNSKLSSPQEYLLSAPKSLLSHVTRFDSTLLTYAALICVAVIFIIYHKTRFLFFPLLLSLSGYLSGAALCYLNGVNENSFYAIRMMILVLLLYAFEFDFKRGKKPSSVFRLKNGYYLTSLAAIAVVFGLSFILQPSLSVTEKSLPQHLMAEIARNPDYYFVMDTDTADNFFKTSENYVHPLWGFRENYLKNVDSFGYFHNNETLRKRNLPENIYEAVLKRRKIYVIDKFDIFDKEYYFNLYYSGRNRISYQKINKLDEYSIYELTVS